MAAIGVRQLAVGAAAAALAWLVGSNGVAAGLARSDPALAAGIAPDADRMSRAAQHLFFERHYAAASAAARQSLVLSPLQTRAARVLGQSELALGHEDAGLAAMDVAARGGWRDNVTQLWTMQAALAGGDYPTALQRADALIRRDAIRDQVFAELRPFAAEPAARAALVERLTDQPDWRGLMFLDWRHAAPAELPGIAQLIADIDRTRQPVTDLELFPLVERLLELGAIAPAQALWRARAPRAGWIPGNLLYDGRFAVARGREDAATPPRFEWWVDPDGTSLASVESASDGRGSALRLSSNPGDPAVLARQTLVLPPGDYQLLARFHARSGRDLDGLDFTLRCSPRQQDILLRDARITQMNADKLRYAGAVTIPTDCPRQDLIVKADGGVAFAATVEIEEVAIQPVARQ